MIKIIFLLIAAAVSIQSFAQDGTITKAKGNSAVVRFPPGTALHVGDAVSLGGSDAQFIGGSTSSSSSSSDMKGSRDHLIDFSAEFLSGSNAGGGSHTVISVAAKYGWNKVTMEYGPEASFSSTSPGSATSFGAGGFFDYNLIPNKRGTVLIYGAGADATIGSASANGSSGSTMNAFGGGFVKWFPLGNTVAVRGDGGFDYLRTVLGSVTTTETDFVVKGGLAVYF